MVSFQWSAVPAVTPALYPLGESDFWSDSNRTIGPNSGLRWSPSDSRNRRPQKSGRVDRIPMHFIGRRAG